MLTNTLTDLQKQRLLVDLYVANESYDLLLDARNAFVNEVLDKTLAYVATETNSNVLRVSSAVLRYLAKRNLGICLQLSETEVARHATLRTARQLGYSEQALKATQ